VSSSCFVALSPHLRAVLTGLLVTALWTSSWVFIKRGLHDEPYLPALPFAGLRYFLAFLCLLPIALSTANREHLRALTASDLRRLLLIGLVWYAVAQGAQFAALALLPAATLSLLLNLTFIPVTLLGILFLAEHPTPRQWLGMGVAAVGTLVFFARPETWNGQGIGLLVGLIAMLSNAGGALLGREMNRSERLPPIIVTTVSMGIGAIVLLVGGMAWQGLPRLTLTGWAIIAWLAVVNTAFAFTLWNRTLRTLTAMESSLIGSTMMPQIALAAYLFLDEVLTIQKLAGMALAIVGALLVQWKRTKMER
jgi:drug/metabolite transporter (DMT)-like permease